MEKIPLSVAIITKNEAHHLADCLEALTFAQQIVVVDSGSCDETTAVAAAFGCEVFVEEWKGFGRQKQSAIEKCRCEWVLVLDADERIPEETARAIRRIVLEEVDAAAGYSFPRKNFFQGRWIRHMGWWPDRIVRLFRRDQGRMSEAIVHEAVVVDGSVRGLDCCIEHMTESRLTKLLLKIDHYSTLGAEQAFSEGRRSSVGAAFFRAALTFIQTYFLRLGILEGAAGLTLAVTDSINKFFKYAKLWELNKAADRLKK